MAPADRADRLRLPRIVVRYGLAVGGGAGEAGVFEIEVGAQLPAHAVDLPGGAPEARRMSRLPVSTCACADGEPPCA